MSAAIDIIIYHNPACGTSRNTLGLIRNCGVEPRIVEYLKTPPSRAELASLIERMGISRARSAAQKGNALRRVEAGRSRAERTIN